MIVAVIFLDMVQGSGLREMDNHLTNSARDVRRVRSIHIPNQALEPRLLKAVLAAHTRGYPLQVRAFDGKHVIYSCTPVVFPVLACTLMTEFQQKREGVSPRPCISNNSVLAISWFRPCRRTQDTHEKKNTSENNDVGSNTTGPVLFASLLQFREKRRPNLHTACANIVQVKREAYFRQKISTIRYTCRLNSEQTFRVLLYEFG